MGTKQTETVGQLAQRIVQTISVLDGDAVGSTPLARALIMALIDQAGYSVEIQVRVETLLCINALEKRQMVSR